MNRDTSRKEEVCLTRRDRLFKDKVRKAVDSWRSSVRRNKWRGQSIREIESCELILAGSGKLVSPFKGLQI